MRAKLKDGYFKDTFCDNPWQLTTGRESSSTSLLLKSVMQDILNGHICQLKMGTFFCSFFYIAQGI